MSDEITTLLRSIKRQVTRIGDTICNLPPPSIRVDQAYRVQEAARLLSVNVRTIHPAHKEGKLVEAQRLTANTSDFVLVQDFLFNLLHGCLKSKPDDGRLHIGSHGLGVRTLLQSEAFDLDWANRGFADFLADCLFSHFSHRLEEITFVRRLIRRVAPEC